MLFMSKLETRYDIAIELNERKLTRVAVEIGTHRGVFANEFRLRWSGYKLFCVDPWYNPEGYEDQAKLLPEKGENRLADFEEAKRVLTPFGATVEMREELSLNAVKLFRNDVLDFVYIDGDHSLEAVTADLEAWYEKVRVGGILAGHDFLCPGEPDGSWGRFIQPAVMGFAEKKRLDIHLICEYGQPWSYYMVKQNG